MFCKQGDLQCLMTCVLFIGKENTLQYSHPVSCAQVRHRHRAYIPVDRLFQSKVRIEVMRVEVEQQDIASLDSQISSVTMCCPLYGFNLIFQARQSLIGGVTKPSFAMAEVRLNEAPFYCETPAVRCTVIPRLVHGLVRLFFVWVTSIFAFFVASNIVGTVAYFRRG